MPEDDRYSLTELADLGGVTPRTVRYYLAQGLLPSVGSSGPGSKYDPGHLARLRLIRRLQAEHLPLAEIRRRLEALTDDEIAGLAGQADPPPPSDSALDYLRSVLDGSSALRRSAEPPLAPVRVPPPRLSPASLSRGRRTTEVAGMAVREAAVEGAGPLPTPSAPLASAAVPAAPAAPERATERSQWERVVITPDVELHIRRPLVRAQNKQVDRLIAIARELLEEERP
jgi:DNA-binding transcriptional MerR regulator